ncbi:MAG: hydantoinase/oxoprolinase family protein, partial [SAR324 cluster bacterium]|nr:hydantoinase/oxoprolinase family protein [SAR324 cluster bacterium]
MRHPNAPALGIGIDTGGTFTDIVLFDLAAQRILRKAKTPTTHGNFSICIGEAFRAVALAAGESQALRRVCLSTTLATNAVAENRIHPTGMILEPGDIRIPQDLHPRLVLLRSQIDFDCVEVVPVSRDEVLEKSEPMAGQVESFAVSGYASTRDPRHE